MDKFKIFDEINDKVIELLDFELTDIEKDAVIDMLMTLIHMQSRQIMEIKKEYESIM